MIAFDMKPYSVSSYSMALDDYGFPIKHESSRTIEMAIYLNTYNVTNNVLYQDCDYMGLTYGDITDRDTIEFDNKILKVIHVTEGRIKQVFMKAQ